MVNIIDCGSAGLDELQLFLVQCSVHLYKPLQASFFICTFRSKQDVLVES